MRVLLYGEADCVGSGAWCYARTLRELGHQIRHVSPSASLAKYQSSFVWKFIRRVYGDLLPGDRTAHVALLTSAAAQMQPDILIVLKGLLLGSDDIRNLKDHAHWVVNINHDDFFSRNPNNWSARQRAAIPSYDYVFTTRAVNVGEIGPLNSNVEFFPFAYDPAIHRPISTTEENREHCETDVLFVGTWERSRAEMLERLVQAVPARYAIYGSQWDALSAKSPLRKCTKHRELIGDEMAEAIGVAKISLGFLRKENRDEYTQRSFEIPACGGVLLAERTAQHRLWFVEGRDAEFFDADDVDELCSKVRLLLADESHRENLRRNGRQAVIDGHHTYRDRLHRLFELYAEHHRCA